MSIRVALVFPTNLWFCPFVKIYTKILNDFQMPYECIYWDKFRENRSIGIAYRKLYGTNLISKFWGYRQFSKFVQRELERGDFTHVIVFTSQVGLFCANYLKKHFAQKYIFDFRDLSIEQNIIFRHALNTLLKNSFANVISSPGFKNCLPISFKYYLSHNFIYDEVLKALEVTNVKSFDTNKINILTIGGIRDYESNKEILDALGNVDGIKLSFVGKGSAAKPLQEYAEYRNFKNVEFKGYYEKEEEPNIIQSATFLNIYYPPKITHATALSNRFYNSLIYRKPMIVTKGQIQGEYCEKYNLGVAISNTESLEQKLKNWLIKTNAKSYDINCVRLLSEFQKDYIEFVNVLKKFLKQ